MQETFWEEWCQHPGDAVAYVDLATGEETSFADFRRRVDEIAPSGKASLAAPVALAEPNSRRWLERFLFLLKHRCPAILLDAGLEETAAKNLAGLCGATWFWSDSGEWIRTDGTGDIPENTVLVKVTSGSTGVPGRVPCSSQHLRADGSQVMSTMDIRSGDRQLGLIPFGHSYGIGNLLMPWILQGNPIYSAAEATPGQIPDWVAKFNLDVFPTVPVFIKLLAQSPSIQSLAPLRTVISAGAPLSPEVAQQFHRKFNLFVHNFYGASETGGICYDRSGEAGISGLGVGQPLDGVEVGVEEDGRIRVTSPAVAMPGNTHLLEDIGEMSENDTVILRGRVEPWANIGGKKVRPAEIAAVLENLEGVDESWVGILSGGDRQWLRAVVATVRSEKDLRSDLLNHLPAWKVPREIRVVNKLPRTARGKLDRQLLTKR